MKRVSRFDVFVVAASAALAAALLYSCSWGRELSWTMPTRTAVVDSLGRTIDCANGEPVHQLAGWRILAQVQSRTWIQNSARMEADPAEYARLWPAVRSEASPQQVRSASSKHLPNGGAGARMTVTVPDSLDGQPVLCWYVVTFNDSGRVSCRSNLRTAR